MRRRHTIVTAVGLAAVLTLTGCTQNSDQSAVDSLALKSATAHLAKGDHAEVVGTWTWRSGYAVLTKTTGKNDKGPYSYLRAYGYDKTGGTWKVSESNLVDADQWTPAKTPHKATCMALSASNVLEQEQCAKLTD